jgi:hypothetical protein
VTVMTELHQRVYEALSTVLLCACPPRANGEHHFEGCPADVLEDATDQVVQNVGVLLAEVLENGIASYHDPGRYRG